MRPPIQTCNFTSSANAHDALPCGRVADWLAAGESRGRRLLNLTIKATIWPKQLVLAAFSTHGSPLLLSIPLRTTLFGNKVIATVSFFCIFRDKIYLFLYIFLCEINFTSRSI
jgi:hypothetical protein